ncbi:proline-rich protein 2-like [Lontra canadensis]|uniref:proline-rich protein 2-like n=1 Tax=Lontra canadensis TaxID=76717 RepID=UPI0013F31562|nr:proline-rich protein 2-like [Lontra canadensis]
MRSGSQGSAPPGLGSHTSSCEVIPPPADDTQGDLAFSAGLGPNFRRLREPLQPRDPNPVGVGLSFPHARPASRESLCTPRGNREDKERQRGGELGETEADRLVSLPGGTAGRGVREREGPRTGLPGVGRPPRREPEPPHSPARAAAAASPQPRTRRPAPAHGFEPRGAGWGRELGGRGRAGGTFAQRPPSPTGPGCWAQHSRGGAGAAEAGRGRRAASRGPPKVRSRRVPSLSVTPPTRVADTPGLGFGQSPRTLFGIRGLGRTGDMPGPHQRSGLGLPPRGLLSRPQYRGV